MNTFLVEISARHLHVSEEHLEILFGKGYKLTLTPTASGTEET